MKQIVVIGKATELTLGLFGVMIELAFSEIRRMPVPPTPPKPLPPKK